MRRYRPTPAAWNHIHRCTTLQRCGCTTSIPASNVAIFGGFQTVQGVLPGLQENPAFAAIPMMAETTSSGMIGTFARSKIPTVTTSKAVVKRSGAAWGNS